MVDDDEEEEEEEEDDELDMGVKEEEDDDDEEEEEEGGERRNKRVVMTGMSGIGGAVVHHIHDHQFQQLQIYHSGGGVGLEMDSSGGGGNSGLRRSRPKEEKERTKLRERHRRAITARILSGLRRHGNYNLRVRADINDVIAALAREAGWMVLPDGTTLPPSRPTHNTRSPAPSSTVLTSPVMVASQTSPTSSHRGVSGLRNSVEYRPCRLKGVFTPTVTSFDGTSGGRPRLGAMMGDGSNNVHLLGSSIEGEDKQIMEFPPRVKERDFAGTPYVPVYVTLPLGVINLKCELVDPDLLIKQLKTLKSSNVDGVMVDCWWGVVESHAPQQYNWHGYKRLFQIVHDLNFKLQVMMSFHECGGNVGDDVCIPLPHWIVEIGRSNPDIFFTDRHGRRNPECLSCGIDKERVLRGRTAVEVYFDYMRSFRVEFDEFFKDGTISKIYIGLGPCGELRYPSYPIRHGWRYPGIGEFQCYDQYLLKSLRKAAEKRGNSFWARGPDNAGVYNSQPHETRFFCDSGDYDSHYGRFFHGWYSQILIDHADNILFLARLAFEGTCIGVKLSGIHWWYKTASHAPELTAGFYNTSNRDGYAPLAQVLKKHQATLNFVCAELHTLDQQEDFSEALADPEGLMWQVLNDAWDVNIKIASENALPCHDRDGYNKILDHAKPLSDSNQRHLSSFTYLRLSSALMERHNYLEFEYFLKRMHGKL